MRHPIIFDGAPYIDEYFRKDTVTLFNETGGNTGNLAFRYAVARHIRNPTFLSWQDSISKVRSSGDVIVLPLANQLGRHTDLHLEAERLSAFKLPVVAIGLGAQSASIEQDVTLTDGTLHWLETLARLRPASKPNLGLRGEYTKAQVTRLGFGECAVVMGCPSNFINLHQDVSGLVSAGYEREPRRIAVNAGIPYISELGRLEANLADLVTGTDGAYIIQHNLDMLRLSRQEFSLVQENRLELFRSYIQPGLSIDAFCTWCRDHAIAFYDVRAWMEYVRRFDFVIGTRFHGAMLAIQAGVPAACIAHDSRTFELCKTTGVPVRWHSEIVETITRSNVRDIFRFDAADYREARQLNRQSYATIYEAADIEMTNAFQSFS
jgi:hypothetical protein